MRIGELAERTGTTPRMLRHYEDQGLIRSTRAANGYRDFDENQVSAVTAIRDLVSAGLPLKLVVPLLQATSTDRGVDPAHLEPAVVDELQDHWLRLCRCIDCITARRDALGDYLNALS